MSCAWLRGSIYTEEYFITVYEWGIFSSSSRDKVLPATRALSGNSRWSCFDASLLKIIDVCIVKVSTNFRCLKDDNNKPLECLLIVVTIFVIAQCLAVFDESNYSQPLSTSLPLDYVALHNANERHESQDESIINMIFNQLGPKTT